MMKNTKYLIFILAIFVSISSNAMSTAEICQWRGKMLAAMAVERDKGVSQRDVVNFAFKQFGKHGVKRSTLNEYASAIYSRRDVSPDIFYQLGELSCLQEFSK